MTSSTQVTDAQVTEDKALDAEEYLTFYLGAEEYGIQILNVQEIRGYDVET